MPRPTRRFAFLIALVVLVAMLAARSWVVVDETRYVLVTSFGRPAALYGDADGETGLHAKWPWQGTWSVDRRLQVSEPPAREVITGDKKNLEVATYAVWRVSEPMRFLNSAGTLEAASARLEERVAAALSDAVGRRELDSLATTDADLWALDDLTTEVTRDVADAARSELGLEVVDVRLRRFNYPVEVRPAVFDLIRSERRQVAATLRPRGRPSTSPAPARPTASGTPCSPRPTPRPNASGARGRPRPPDGSTPPTPAIPPSPSSCGPSKPTRRSSTTRRPSSSPRPVPCCDCSARDRARRCWTNRPP